MLPITFLIWQHHTIKLCNGFLYYLECLPGYFGTNCLSQCKYPNYGQNCHNTCDCTVKECNHVDGCQGNHTQTETSKSWLTKHTSIGDGYKHMSQIIEGTCTVC